MVMLTPALNLLHARYGLPCHVIGTGSWSSVMYQGHPDVSGVWSFHRHVPFLLDGAWGAVRRALRDSHPGPIYVCEAHYRQLPRIRRMLRLSGVDSRRCLFLADEPPVSPEHLADRLVRFGQRTPVSVEATDYRSPPSYTIDGPRLHILQHERTARDAWLKTRGWYDRDLVLVQPGNHRTMGWRRARSRRRNTDDKWWPLENWVALLKHVHACRPEAMLLLCGSSEEVPMLEEIRSTARLPNLAVASGSLRELFALCEVAHSMISVDTGPAHAAAALSLPVVVLFGAQPAKYWLPRSPAGSPAAGVGGPPRSMRVDQIPLQDVIAAWHSVVEQTEPRSRRHSSA